MLELWLLLECVQRLHRVAPGVPGNHVINWLLINWLLINWLLINWLFINWLLINWLLITWLLINWLLINCQLIKDGLLQLIWALLISNQLRHLICTLLMVINVFYLYYSAQEMIDTFDLYFIGHWIITECRYLLSTSLYLQSALSVDSLKGQCHEILSLCFAIFKTTSFGPIRGPLWHFCVLKINISWCYSNIKSNPPVGTYSQHF